VSGSKIINYFKNKKVQAYKPGSVMPMLPSASFIIYLVLMLPSASSSLPNPE